MTPTLSAYVLALPLPVRIALLDADPTGAGWLVPVGCVEPGNCYVVMRVTLYERGRVRAGAAWLPCSPLAIVEHAASLAAKTVRGRDCWPHASRAISDKWVMHIKATGADFEVRVIYAAQDKCPHTAAIKLLEEVLRG